MCWAATQIPAFVATSNSPQRSKRPAHTAYGAPSRMWRQIQKALKIARHEIARLQR